MLLDKPYELLNLLEFKCDHFSSLFGAESIFQNSNVGGKQLEFISQCRIRGKFDFKYISGPVTSTVSYKFGDDGYGNITFPAVTICLDFGWILFSPNGMFNNCSYLTRGGFHKALEFCTDDGIESSTTTTQFKNFS